MRPRPNAAPRSLLPTIESTDADLQALLLQLSVDGTAAAHRAVAERYRQFGILDKAYDHFQRAAEIDPADAAAHDGLARVWRDWGYPQLGLPDAARAVFFAPRSAPAHNTYGTLLLALGRRREARHEYETAIQVDPTAAYALSNLCYVSFLDGEVKRAATECNAALRIDPSLTPARNNLALAQMAAGRGDLAERGLAHAAPHEAAGFYNIGIARMAAKQYAAAAAAFDAARKAKPDWPAPYARARQARRLLESSALSDE